MYNNKLKTKQKNIILKQPTPLKKDKYIFSLFSLKFVVTANYMNSKQYQNKGSSINCYTGMGRNFFNRNDRCIPIKLYVFRLINFHLITIIMTTTKNYNEHDWYPFHPHVTTAAHERSWALYIHPMYVALNEMTL